PNSVRVSAVSLTSGTNELLKRHRCGIGCCRAASDDADPRPVTPDACRPVDHGHPARWRDRPSPRQPDHPSRNPSPTTNPACSAPGRWRDHGRSGVSVTGPYSPEESWVGKTNTVGVAACRYGPRVLYSTISSSADSAVAGSSNRYGAQ